MTFTLLLLSACGPAVVGFPGEKPAADDGAPDSAGDTTGDTADTAPDTGPCEGAWHRDADGDGFGEAATTSTECEAPSGYVADGADCDDADATVNPGAAEACDGADQDCDGVADDGLGDACAGGPDERDADASGWTVVGGTENDGIGAAVVTSGDLDRDGWPDLVVASPRRPFTDAGAIGLFGADTAAVGVAFDSGVLVTGAAAGDQLGASLALLGDLDGDGWDELLAGAPYGDDEATNGGEAWVFDLAEGGGQVSRVASARIVGRSDDGRLGAAVSAGDLDGDGAPELVLGAPGAYAGRGAVYVHPGDEAWWDGLLDDEDLDTNLLASSTVALGAAVLAGADLDGDGDGDLVACGPAASAGAGTCWLVTEGWGEDLEDGDVTSLAAAAFTGAAAADAVGSGPGTLAVADLDGDGQADLALGAPGHDGGGVDGGAVAVWWGGALEGVNRLDDADLLVVGDGALGTAVAALPGAGGAHDLLAGAPTAGAGTLYHLAGLGAGGRLDASADAVTRWSGTVSGDAFGSAAGALADLDGDGEVDLAVSAPASDAAAVDGGTVYVLTP